MSRDPSQFPNLQMDLPRIAQILQKGGRITRSKKGPNSRNNYQRLNNKSKALLKYQGQPELKSYMQETNLKPSFQNNYQQYLINKRLKILSKDILPQNCLLFQKVSNNCRIKQVKLLQKKSKTSQYIIQQKQQQSRQPQARGIGLVQNSGLLAVGQTLVFICMDIEQFKKIFQPILQHIKKNYKPKQIVNFVSINEQVSINAIGQQGQNIQNMQNIQKQQQRAYSISQIKQQVGIQNVIQSQQINLKQIQDFQQKIFKKLANSLRYILWPALVLQILNGETEDIKTFITRWQIQMKQSKFQNRPQYSLFCQAYQQYLIDLNLSSSDRMFDSQPNAFHKQCLQNKVDKLQNYLQKQQIYKSTIFVNLIGSLEVKQYNKNYLRWEQFNYQQLTQILTKTPFKNIIQQINNYIKALNQFKIKQNSGFDVRHSIFRIGKYYPQEGNIELCIPIRYQQSNAQKKVLIRLLKDDYDTDNHRQILKWVDQNKIKINNTFPKHNQNQKMFYYLIGRQISVEEGISYLYSSFYYRQIKFQKILKKCYPQEEIRRKSVKNKRCVYCRYMIDDLPFYRCKYCLQLCHTQCTNISQPQNKQYLQYSNTQGQQPTNNVVWNCKQCTPCNQCQTPVQKNYLECDTCKGFFHKICGKLKLIIDNQGLSNLLKYTCQNCLKCKICSVKLKNSEYNIQDKKIFCLKCYKDYKKDQYCVVCIKIAPGNWFQCGKQTCKKWVHQFCDNFLKGKVNTDDFIYYCPFCRIKQRRKIFKFVVQQLKCFDQCQYYYQPQYQQILGYRQQILEPFCLVGMRQKIIQGGYDINPYDSMLKDLNKIVKNAMTFNMPKDDPYYRAKILLVVGQKFLTFFQNILNCSDQYLINQKLFDILKIKRKQFYHDLHQNYLSYLLNYGAQRSKIQVKRLGNTNYDSQLFCSKVLLNKLFNNSQFKFSIKKKPPNIQNLFTVPRLQNAGWWPIRINVCYYHPEQQNQIIYYCNICNESFCCTETCHLHHLCTNCGIKGCSCDNFLCGCPPLNIKQKKIFQNKIISSINTIKTLDKRQYTQYYKYCFKCVLEKNAKTNICYICKYYCFYNYEKCIQCSKIYHKKCESKANLEEMKIFYEQKQIYQGNFEQKRIQNICYSCSKISHNIQNLSQILKKQTKSKTIKLKKISEYLSCILYIFDLNGIRLTNDQIIDLLYKNYSKFISKQRILEQFKNNFNIVYQHYWNHRIILQIYKQQFMNDINKKALAHQASHQKYISIVQSKELKQQKLNKKFYKIASKLFNGLLFQHNIDYKSKKIKNSQQNQVKIFKQENHLNSRTFEKIRIQIITSCVSPKSKKNIYYTHKMQKIKNILNLKSNYYQIRKQKIQNRQRNRNNYMISQVQQAQIKMQQQIQQQYLQHLRFNLQYQITEYNIVKDQNYRSLLFQSQHIQPYNCFDDIMNIYKPVKLVNFISLDKNYLNYKSQIMIKFLTDFFLKMFQQNKIVLKKGITSILSQNNNCWRVLKHYKNHMVQIKLQKIDQSWYLHINQSKYKVNTIQDIIKKLSQFSSSIKTFDDVVKFMGFGMMISSYYQPHHFTHYLQVSSVDSVSRLARKAEAQKIYKNYKWNRQGQFSCVGQLQGKPTTFNYNVTKKPILFLKKIVPEQKKDIQIQQKVTSFITFQDIKKDLDDNYSILQKDKDNFVIKQPTHDVYIGPSKIDRLGLFIKNNTKKNTIVTQYIGQVISESLADIRQQKYSFFGCYMFGLTKTNTRLQIIDATFQGNMARYLNHSCDPNCKARIQIINGNPRIFIYTIKDILANQQLTYDYQFKIDTKNRLICKCKAQNCQGRLT